MIDPKATAEAPAKSGSGARGEPIFETLDLQPLEGWLERTAVTAELKIERRGVEEITESYLDTDDGRLLRAGFCLRVSERNGLAAAALEPIAIEPSLGSGWQETLPPGTRFLLEEQDSVFGGRLRLLTGGRPLSRRIEVRGHLQSITIRGVGEAGCEMVIEETTVPIAGADLYPRATRVTLSPQPAGDANAIKLVERLRATCPLRPSTTTRFQAVIATLGLAPGPAGLGPERVERSQTVAQAGCAVLRRHFRRMLSEETGTRLGEDIEALHDMRVAIRRQRAALRLFRDYLPPGVIRIKAELKRIASILGQVRDLDVHLAMLEEWKKELGPEDRAALDALRDRLMRGRNVARRKMVGTLDARRYQRLVERMSGLLCGDPSRRFAPGRASIRATAPGLIGERYDRAMKLARKIGAKSATSDYHRLRIRCKALRYALEFHADLYGKPAQRMIRALVALQDLLGEHHDADVAAKWLHGLIGERGSRLGARTAFVAGRLAERYERRARRLRGKFHDRLKPVTGKSWSRLHSTMQREALAGSAATLRRRPNDQAVRDLQARRRRGTRRKMNTRLSQPDVAGGISE